MRQRSGGSLLCGSDELPVLSWVLRTHVSDTRSSKTPPKQSEDEALMLLQSNRSIKFQGFFFFSEDFVLGAESAFQSGKWVAYLGSTYP